jgi:hypothetical protein
MKVSIVIPCYNEKSTIEKVVEALPSARTQSRFSWFIFLGGRHHHLTDQQIDEILGLARACLRPGGRFIFYETCFSANDDWVGRMFMRLDRGGNIKTDQAWRALLSEHATVEEHIRRPVYLFRYTIQTLIARDPREP